MRTEQLQNENERLRKAVAGLTLDKLIPSRASQADFDHLLYSRPHLNDDMEVPRMPRATIRCSRTLQSINDVDSLCPRLSELSAMLDECFAEDSAGALRTPLREIVAHVPQTGAIGL